MRNKNYETPLCEVFEIEIENAILQQSEATVKNSVKINRFGDGGAA